MTVTRLAAPLLVIAGSIAFAGATQAQPAAMGGPKMLIHGNYCGPGNNAPLPPIDALDAACARHDACTPQGGLPSKACNARLQQEAEAISRDPRVPKDERAMAGMIAIGATIIPTSPQGRGFADAPGGRPMMTGSIRNAPPLRDPVPSDDGDGDDDGE